MKWILYEENNWGHDVEEDAVEGTVLCACKDEGVQVLNEMKTGNAPLLSDVSL